VLGEAVTVDTEDAPAPGVMTTSEAPRAKTVPSAAF
jgi:hypothetical protein